MEAEGRWGPMSLRRLYAELERLYGGDSTLEVRCTSLWGGERYLLHFYEVYRDAEAFKLHWDGASMKTVRTEMGDRMVKMTGVRCASA